MRRPVVALHWLLLATIGYVVVIGNQPLWLKLLEIDPSIEGRLAAFHLLTALAALFTLLLIPTTHRFLLKPLLFVLLLVVALVSWFEGQFGIVIDSAIIQSALETDRMEAGELMSLAFFGHLAIQWLLPIAVVAWVRIDYGRFRYLPRLLIGSVFASGILALALLSGYKEISLLLRHHDELKMMVNPTYALFSTWKVLSSRVHTAPLVREALGDAVTTRDEQAPPRILVLVVGETARADHFSLNGYPRATDPRLGARSLINFGPVASCGTAAPGVAGVR